MLVDEFDLVFSSGFGLGRVFVLNDVGWMF